MRKIACVTFCGQAPMKPLAPKIKSTATTKARTAQKLFAALAASLCLPVFAHAASAPAALDGDHWTVAPQAEVSGTGEQISAPGFAADKWVKAKVPGTVLEAYVAAGIEKEPTYGDNAYKIDQKKYNRNFWYRTEFKTPAFAGGRTWLEFDGVNKDADVYLNGRNLGSIHGFVQRGRFDVTSLVRPGVNELVGRAGLFPGGKRQEPDC